MEVLVSNVNEALNTLAMDLCRIRVNMYDKDINPYVILSDIANIKIRTVFLKRLLKGVEVNKQVASEIKNKIRSIEKQLKELEGIDFGE